MHKIFYTSLLFTFCLTSCASKKYVYHKINNKANQQINTPKTNPAKNTQTESKISTLEYINQYKAIAIREMKQYGIPASITLAQGILESGSGNSILAINANNHFGVKCNSSWAGEKYYKDDDTANECFRAYNNPEQSFIDHSVFLKRPRYAQLFTLETTDYKGWAHGLKQCGYATNPQYAQLLISYIEKYNLQSFDDFEGEVYNNEANQANTQNIPAQPSQTTLVLQPNQYLVQKGDTLYNLSKRFFLSVDELIDLNNLADNGIKLGQILIIKK